MSAIVDRDRLEFADQVSLGADCTRRSVGAALYSAQGHLVGIGANRSRVQFLSCTAGQCPRGTKTYVEVPSYEQGNHDFETGDNHCIAAHAERTATVNAWAFRDCVLYVTCEPCADCWRLIKGGKPSIVRVVWPGREWIRGES